MSTGITLAKIVVLSALLAAFLGAEPLMELMRRHDIWPMATAQVRVAPPPPVVQAATKSLPRVRRQVKTTKGHVKTRRAASSDVLEVPAETVLPVLLRAPLDSHTTRVEERVKAILRNSVKQGSFELVPAASIIHGKVLDVVPASRWQPRGRIVVGFFFIEHALTGERIAIAARPVVFEPVDATGATATRRSVDVRVNAGEVLHVRLAEPLSVRFRHY